MLRSAPRTYPLPYPAVFDAVSAVLSAARPLTASDRVRGRIEQRSRRRRVTVYVGAEGTTHATVVVDVDGALPLKRDLARFMAALDEYLRYYFTPAST